MKTQKISELNRRLVELKKMDTSRKEIQDMIRELEATINYLQFGGLDTNEELNKIALRIESAKSDERLAIHKIPYREVVDINLPFKNEISTLYLGSSITYEELIKKIDKTAVCLQNFGIKRNDIVTICAPTTPEIIYLFYALNKLGAIANILDPRKDETELKYCINLTGSQTIFVIDSAYSKIKEIFNKSSLTKMFVVSPVESKGIVTKLVYNKDLLKEQKRSRNLEIAYWPDLEKYYYDSATEVEEDVYVPNTLRVIEYTSGTTGNSKGVEITNDAISGISRQYDLSGMKHERKDKFYNGIPIFLSFGEALGIHMPYCFGMKNIVNPQMEADKILYDLIKYKPEHTSLTPYHYIVMLQNPDIIKYDMTNVKTLGVGADSMTYAKKEQFNKVAHANGCKVGITMGYGNTEHNSSFATERDKYYKIGSCGRCLEGNIAIIIDPETKEILPPNVVGKIILIGRYPMKGYHNNELENKKTFIKLSEGVIGIDLQDYGYIDDEGFLYAKGREKDLIKTENGNIWPSEIENIVSISDSVDYCGFSGNEHGKLRLFIVRNKDYTLSECQKQVLEIVEKIEKIYKIKIDVSYVKELPITSNGKIDRHSLACNEFLHSISYDTEDEISLKKLKNI